MKTTLTPILASEIDQTTARFFAPEFASQQLGQPGCRVGVESERMGMKTPVTKTELDHLLQGNSPGGNAPVGGPWRQPDQAVGWVLTFPVDYRHNALWALGNAETKKLIETSHEFAVRESLDQIDQVLRRAAGFRADAPTGALYTMFTSGTGKGQVPQLQTAVIIPHGHLRDDASVMTFPAAALTRCEPRLQKLYLCHFTPRAFHALGRVGCPEAEVPKALFRPLAEDHVITGGPQKGKSLVFVGDDLFTQWGRQGQARGFGAAQVTELLREARVQAKRHGVAIDIESATSPGFRSMAKSLWQHCMGSPTQSHSRTVSNNGHQPSV